MSKANMSDELLKDMYSHKDFHTMYFGEIIDAYEL